MAVDAEAPLWWATVGADMFGGAFACLIEGGRLPGSGRRLVGCDDQRPPLDERAAFLPYRLVCGGESRFWPGGGVAQLDGDEDPGQQTLAYLWLLRPAQVLGVLRQITDDPTLQLDLEALLTAGSLPIGSQTSPRRLLVHGRREGYPVLLTSTATRLSEAALRPPSDDCLRCLIAGLRENFALNKQGCRKYLRDLPGISGTPSAGRLSRLFGEAEVLLADPSDPTES